MSYYTAQEAQGGMAILAGWLGRNYKVKVQYHNGTAVDANIETGTIRIPKLACASGVTEEALQLLRSMVYHESGHIAETKLAKSEYPAGALFTILNGLEDRRIERVLADEHLGCKEIFGWAMGYFNKRIAGQIAEQVANGAKSAPLWEAICAMGFMVEGLQPAWRLTPKAAAYVKAAYDEFSKVRGTKSTKDCLVLAKKIYDLIKDASDEFNKQNEPPKSEGKAQQNKNEKGQKGDKNQKSSKPQSSQADDVEDDKDEGKDGDEDGEGESKPKKDSKGKGDQDEDEKSDKDEKKSKGKGKDSEDKDGDDKDDKSEDSEGKSEKDSDKKDSDKKDSDKKDSDKKDSDKGDDDAEDEDDESEDGEGDEDSDEEGDEGSEGEGDEDDDESDGDEDGDEGKGGGAESDDDLDSEADKPGDDSKGEGSESGDSKGDNDSESDGLSGDEGAEDSKGDAKGKNDVRGEDQPYEPQDSDDDMAERQGKTDLEEEAHGASQAEILNERLDELFSELSPADKDYLALRDADQHLVPDETSCDRENFIERRADIASGVSAMTRALEQALRSLAKVKKNPYLRQGKIDKKRLVAITKSLSKEVFFKTRPGEDLNVAVEIIIDESGSMSNYIDVQKVAIAIGEALSQIGVSFEITGTTTMFTGGDSSMPYMPGFSRTNPIIYRHYKSFEENWVAVRSRITQTGAHFHNVDGEAVEFAAFRLAQRKETRKIIFSLSDGQPCAGHGNDGDMCHNLKRVCERTRKNRIEVYGFGIGTMAPEAFYGPKYFVFLNKNEGMGETFVRKFADVITGGRVRV